MPGFGSTEERGEAFWDVYNNPNTSNIMDFWDNQYGSAISTELGGVGFNPAISMFTHGSFWGPGDDQWAVDPGEMYRAEEAGEISTGLHQDKYRSLIPQQERRYGVGGFASSGIQPKRNLFDEYTSGMGEIAQETEASITDVYEIYGRSAENTISSLLSSGGFSSEFAGGEGEWGEVYDELESAYGNWDSWPGGGSFADQLQNCVENELNNMDSAGNLSGPNDMFIAVETCRQAAS